MTFTAYIVSYLDPKDEDKRAARLAVHNEQLDQWLTNTDMTVHVVSMNYREDDYRRDERVVYLDSEPLRTAAARRVAFQHFYDSDTEWAVMMDNDSWLYSETQHNSGYQLFREMSEQIDRYRGIGMFFPINPQKSPFTELLADEAHTQNHVFKVAMDLKGSLFCVRNFRAAGQPCVWPDTSYTWQEDTKLAFDAVALGHRVMRCENIVLLEKGLSSSSFGDVTVDRKPFMREANARIAGEYWSTGLEMDTGDKDHLLDYQKWVARNLKGSRSVVVPKDIAAMNAGGLWSF